MMIKLLRGLLALSALLLLTAPVGATVRDPELEGAQCARQISALVQRLAPGRVWTALPDSQLHARVRRTRGFKIGSWLITNTYPDGHVELLLRTIDEAKLLTWEQPDCRLQYASRKINAPVPAHPFTDSDLEALVGGKKAGLVYAWSPNMPLSEDSVRDIAEAARSLGLELAFVADPNVKGSLVERVVKRDRLKIIKPKQMYSLELAMLGMHLHYPSTLVYADGRIISEFPGAKSSGAYVKLIREALDHDQK